MPTRVLLLGAGAIGAFFGSRLAAAPNVLVSAVCRSNYDAVKKNGFRITSPNFPENVWRPEHTFNNAEEARQRKLTWDFLVVATKALPELGDESERLVGLVGEDSSIVLMQNGIGIEDVYTKRFPKATVLSSTTLASCLQPEPGIIRHNEWLKTHVGPYLPDSHATTAEDDVIVKATSRNNHFAGILRAGGIKHVETHSHANMQFVRWHKVAINAAMNPTSVLSGCIGNREITLDADLVEHCTGVVNEVLSVAAQILGQSVPLKELKLTTTAQVLENLRVNGGESRPSMLEDWELGRKMELEVILGNPIRIARRRGLEMPRLQTMYAVLRKCQERRLTKL